MHVRDGMTHAVATVAPTHTLREAAAKMAAHGAGAAVVVDEGGREPELVTEHDILVSLARGQDPDREKVADHIASTVLLAEPGWTLELAATVMVSQGWRHLIVWDKGKLIGVLSMRDVVCCWTQSGAGTRLPSELEAKLKRRPVAEVDAAKADGGRESLDSVLGF